MPALTTGTTAPEFTLPTIDGSTFSLPDALQRGPVVLAFFKISCPVCQYAFPYFERVYHNFRGKNVTFVGVSQNPKADTLAFLREYGVTFPTLLDDPGNYPVSNAFGLTNVPTFFYIAPGGEIELSSVGWAREEVEQLNAKLAEAVNMRQAPVFRPGEDVAGFKPG